MRGILMRMKVKIVWQHCFVVTGNYARINGIQQMHVLDRLGWNGLGSDSIWSGFSTHLPK